MSVAAIKIYDDSNTRVAIVKVPTVTTTVITADVPKVVVVGRQGPQGVPGPSGDLSYTHSQIQAANVWNVNHGLGKFPAVSVIDTANTEVEGNVEHIDINNARLTFSAPFSGKAVCN